MRSVTLAFLGLLSLLAGSPAIAGDPLNGETIYNQKCSYCHDLARPALAGKRFPGESFQELKERSARRPPLPSEPVSPRGERETALRRGPHLAGLFSRAPGAVEDFPYRIIFRAAGPVWSAADLDAWIDFHARVGQDERSDLIAYLAQATR